MIIKTSKGWRALDDRNIAAERDTYKTVSRTGRIKPELQRAKHRNK